MHLVPCLILFFARQARVGQGFLLLCLSASTLGRIFLETWQCFSKLPLPIDIFRSDCGWYAQDLDSGNPAVVHTALTACASLASAALRSLRPKLVRLLSNERCAQSYCMH